MRILIVGGGITGLTLAYWLDQNGVAVTLVEKTAAYRPIGSMTAIYGEGMAIADRMGVLPALRQRSFRQERQMLRDREGKLLRTFNLQRAHTLQGGTLTLKRSDWLQVLYDAVAPHAPVRFATTVQSLHETPTGVDVSFSDGTTAIYDLVIGADGLHSAVRGLAFGPDFKRPVGLGVMTFLLDGCGDLLARAGLAPFTVHEWLSRASSCTLPCPATRSLLWRRARTCCGRSLPTSGAGRRW